MPGGVNSRFITGSTIEPKKVFAGNGSTPYKELRVRDRLSEQYGDEATDSSRWSHVSGEGWMFDPDDDGKIKRGEIHWMEHPDIGKVEFYWKRWTREYRDEG